MNLKLFCDHRRIFRFRKKFMKDSGEINPLEVHRNMRGIHLEINCEGIGWVIIGSMLVYHFVDPDLRVKIIFRKEGTTENGRIDFEIEDIGTSAHWYWRLKKISCRACLLFCYFFGDKKIAFKSLFDLYFHPGFF